MLDLNKSISKLNFTKKHQIYHKYLSNKNVKLTIAIGPAGTGKTMLAATHAIHNLINKDIKKIIITRPVVGLEEEIGFLPGNKDEKMLPWIMPIYDVFKEYISSQKLKEYLQNEDIEICPLSYMRGRSFDNSWILADEVQNTTPKQMKALLTRIGHDSRITLAGDLEQCDVYGINGLDDFIQRFNLYTEDLDKIQNIKDVGCYYPIQMIKFDDQDIMRSDLVKEIIKIYK